MSDKWDVWQLDKKSFLGSVVRHIQYMSDNWDVWQLGCLHGNPKVLTGLTSQTICLTNGMSDNWYVWQLTCSPTHHPLLLSIQTSCPSHSLKFEREMAKNVKFRWISMSKKILTRIAVFRISTIKKLKRELTKNVSFGELRSTNENCSFQNFHD